MILVAIQRRDTPRISAISERVALGLFLISLIICSAVSGALCSAVFSEHRLDAFSVPSLCAMSAIIFPAASWQGIVIQKKVRSLIFIEPETLDMA